MIMTHCRSLNGLTSIVKCKSVLQAKKNTFSIRYSFGIFICQKWLELNDRPTSRTFDGQLISPTFELELQVLLIAAETADEERFSMTYVSTINVIPQVKGYWGYLSDGHA